MLRAFIISLSKAAWAQRLATRSRLGWKVASRFVAGETQADAVRVVQELNRHGIKATLDNLGENTTRPEEAEAATQEILSLLATIQRTGVRSNVSLKLSQLGLALDPNLCRQNLVRILTTARETNNFVRVDMEDTPYTQQTLDLVRDMCRQGFENVGVVVQAYLYRTENDVRSLMEEQIRIRLCKGAYREPANLAFPKKKDTDANFDRLLALMLTYMQSASPALHASEDGRFPPLPAVATHDPRRILFAQGLAQRLGLLNQAVEFQMLYGIRRDLQQKLADAGYPVRIYVPYGTHWYPYLTRRLAERPANLWFIASNFFRS